MKSLKDSMPTPERKPGVQRRQPRGTAAKVVTISPRPAPQQTTGGDDLTAMCRAFAGESGEHVTDPALAAYLAWVAAANEVNRVDALLEAMDESSPDRKAMLGQCSEAEQKRNTAADALQAADATTPAGIFGKLAYFTWTTCSCIAADDIRFWQGMVADVARLGIVPLETACVAPFGEGRYFGALHRTAMSPDGIQPDGGPITLQAPLWEPPAPADAELLTAFDLWREASSEVDETKLSDAERNAMVKAESENACKVASSPAKTEAGALAKLSYLIDNTSDNFQDDEDHSAHLAITTLQEAIEHLPVTVAQPIRVALKGLRVLYDGYHDKEGAEAAQSLAAIKRGAKRLSDLEIPLGKAEGVAETLFLLTPHCGDAAEPVAYLTNRLTEHLNDLRRQWGVVLDLIRDAEEGSKC